MIADLVPIYSGGGRMGRPPKWSKRQVVDAVLYVAATGCQWRALPPQYPHCNTVHRYHLTWSRDGAWERIVDRLRGLVRAARRERDPSGSVIDARSVRGASTVGSSTRGYDAAKKVSGHKTLGLVDTGGLLLAVAVVAANLSDNAGGIAAVDRAATKSRRLKKIWHDSGFKKSFATHCSGSGITSQVVNRVSAHSFEVLPRPWVVERTWAWLVNHRRLRTRPRRSRGIRLGRPRTGTPPPPHPTRPQPDAQGKLTRQLLSNMTRQIPLALAVRGACQGLCHMRGAVADDPHDVTSGEAIVAEHESDRGDLKAGTS